MLVNSTHIRRIRDNEKTTYYEIEFSSNTKVEREATSPFSLKKLLLDVQEALNRGASTVTR